jgi:hypothetical protein
MTVTDAMARVLAEVVTIGNGIVSNWVSIPAGASSPLDMNAALTASGNELVGYIASSALRASDIMCFVVDALF